MRFFALFCKLRSQRSRSSMGRRWAVDVKLVAACDIVIASDRAKFGQPEIKLGVFPPIAAILLPAIIGERRARELILTGELIDAEEALRLGLVNYVVPADEIASKTQEVLGKLRELSASALSMTRMALDLGTRQNFESALINVENLYLHELMKTEDAEEGVRAFMEKRKARVEEQVKARMKDEGGRMKGSPVGLSAFNRQGCVRWLSGFILHPSPLLLAVLLLFSAFTIDFSSSAQTQRRSGAHATAPETFTAADRTTVERAIGSACAERIRDPLGSTPIDVMQARPSMSVNHPDAVAGAKRANRLLAITKKLVANEIVELAKEYGMYSGVAADARERGGGARAGRKASAAQRRCARQRFGLVARPARDRVRHNLSRRTAFRRSDD